MRLHHVVGGAHLVRDLRRVQQRFAGHTGDVHEVPTHAALLDQQRSQALFRAIRGS